MKKKFLACLTTCSLLLAMFASSITVQATSQTIKPIYQNELNQSGQTSQTSGGINIDGYISANLNGVTSNSSKATDQPYGTIPASTYIYSTVANAGDLIDVNSTDIVLHANITNTNSATSAANVSLRLDNNGRVPTATNYPDEWSVDAARVQGNDVFDASARSDLNIEYQFNNAASGSTTVTRASVLASGLPAGYGWNDLVRINVSGNLQPNEVVKYNVPLKVTPKQGAKDTYSFQFGNTSGGVYKTATIILKGITRNELVSSVLDTKILATYRNSDGSYTVAENKVQNLMPNATSSNTKFNNFLMQVLSTYENSPADGVLTSNSAYSISTLDIFNAIHNDGYTTLVRSDNTLLPIYAYYNNGSVNLKDADGNPVRVSDYNMNFYAQIIKVLEAPEEVSLNVGDNFDAEQNLISAVNPVDNSPIAYTDLTVTSDVNTAVAGTYHVTYTYTLADGKTISVTTKVKVTSPNTIVNPQVNPANPASPSNPSAPAKTAAKAHISPNTYDGTSAASLVLFFTSFATLGLAIYRYKRFN